MVQVAPPELIETIRAAWEEERDGDAAIPTLPESSVVRQMLEAAFWASMRTEEKRTVSFRLAYFTPRQVASADDGTLASVLFSEAKPLTASALLRLSPALDFRQSLVGVCKRGSVELEPSEAESATEESELVIWGIVDSGMSWWEHTKGEPRRRVHYTAPPNCFTVSSNQPGTMTISCRGRVLLSLRDGEVAAAIPNLLHRGPVGAFFGPTGERLLDEVIAELQADFSGADPKTQHEAEVAYITFLERLVASMREFQHGGAILFVPDHWTTGSPEAEQRLLVKFPTSISSTWELLKEYMRRLNISLRATHDALSTSTVTREFVLELLVTRRQRDRSEDMMRDRASLLASLTRVDGCIVLTRSLDLLGFGGEIICSAPDLEQVYVAQDVEGQTLVPLSIYAVGTRHRSAFRFCHSHEEVAAVILSSDGDVRVARRVGEKVVLWNGLDSPELGL